MNGSPVNLVALLADLITCTILHLVARTILRRLHWGIASIVQMSVDHALLPSFGGKLPAALSLAWWDGRNHL